MKGVKYFALQKDLRLLQLTLGQAIKDLVVFLIMTIILFIGFVVMGLNIFGMQARDKVLLWHVEADRRDGGGGGRGSTRTLIS